MKQQQLQIQPTELVPTNLDAMISLKLQIQDLETGETKFHQIELPPTMDGTGTSPGAEITESCSIGRDLNCQLVLPKPDISRRHARIHRQGQDCYFTDLGSLSGSYFNTIKLKADRSEKLDIGSKIQINNFILRVEEISIGSKPDFELNNNPTHRFVSTDPELTPQAYMPVAHIEPDRFDRWQQGELTVKCVGIIDETGDARTFRFVAEPPVLFSYQPGQFVTLNLEIDDREISRSYSISSTPSRPHTLEITVKRVPPSSPELPRGLVSNWLHDNLEVGSQVQLSGPMGKFTCFEHPAPKLLFLSAGSGITPMMGMSRWIYDTGAECDVTFFHSARTANDVIFRDELELLAARQNNFHLAVSYTGKSGGTGLKGRLTPAMLDVICPDFRDRVVFVCGSNSFMESIKQMFGDLQFPMHNYHQESFSKSNKKKAPKADTPISPVATMPEFGLAAFLDKIQANVYVPATPEVSLVTPSPSSHPTPATSIQVVFEKSGQEVVSDGEESILELAEQAGVKIRSGCRMGSCGACKKLTRSGNVRMEDPQALESSEAAAGYILCCVAYPQDRVVVDA